jgi:hypothetical protein
MRFTLIRINTLYLALPITSLRRRPSHLTASQNHYDPICAKVILGINDSSLEIKHILAHLHHVESPCSAAGGESSRRQLGV